MTVAEVTSANAARVLGTGASVGFLRVGAEAINTSKDQVFWLNIAGRLEEVERSITALPDVESKIKWAASDKEKIDGQIEAIERELGKLKNNGPNEPPRNHWVGEVQGILKRIIRMVEKRMRGKTQLEYLQKIESIRRRLQIEIERGP